MLLCPLLINQLNQQPYLNLNLFELRLLQLVLLQRGQQLLVLRLQELQLLLELQLVLLQLLELRLLVHQLQLVLLLQLLLMLKFMPFLLEIDQLLLPKQLFHLLMHHLNQFKLQHYFLELLLNLSNHPYLRGELLLNLNFYFPYLFHC